MNPKARVYGLPIISGHVGADAAACMLAIDLAHEERLVAIMDIGTNTELIVGNKHKRPLAASCPAGPAFEGGKLSSGMPGLPGAIEKVRIPYHRWNVYMPESLASSQRKVFAVPASSTLFGSFSERGG